MLKAAKVMAMTAMDLLYPFRGAYSESVHIRWEEQLSILSLSKGARLAYPVNAYDLLTTTAKINRA